MYKFFILRLVTVQISQPDDSKIFQLPFLDYTTTNENHLPIFEYTFSITRSPSKASEVETGLGPFRDSCPRIRSKRGVKIETTYGRPRAFTFRPGFRRRFRCACLLFNYPGMRFLALSAPADPDVDPPRASLQRIRFCPFLRFSNCTETDVPPRNFTAIEHRQRATERAGDPLCRDFFMHGQRARMEKAQRRFIRFLALAQPPHPPPFVSLAK